MIKCLTCDKEINSGYWCSNECKKIFLDATNKQPKEGFFKKLFKPIIEKAKKNKMRKEILEDIKFQAEIEAMNNIKDELVKLQSEKLIQKFSKNKGEALKNAFALNINTGNVLERNLGIRKNNNDFETYINRIKEHIILNDDLNKFNIIEILNGIKDIMNKERSFSHGDFTLDNIIINDKIPYFIDPIFIKDLYSSYLLDLAKFGVSCYIYDNVEYYNKFLTDFCTDNLNIIFKLMLSEFIRIFKYSTDIEKEKYLSLMEKISECIRKD